MKSRFTQFIEEMLTKYGEAWKEEMSQEEYADGLMLMHEV